MFGINSIIQESQVIQDRSIFIQNKHTKKER